MSPGAPPRDRGGLFRRRGLVPPNVVLTGPQDLHRKPAVTSDAPTLLNIQRAPALGPLDARLSLASPGDCSAAASAAELGGASPTPAKKQELPERSGYRLGEVLGCGSMAVVRKVTRKSDNRVFAAKRVRTEDEELRHFTREEFEIMHTLRHDSILRSEVLLENSLDMWLVMEYCENGSVRSFVMRQGPFGEEAAKMLLLQLVEGVDYLHCKRIVHRDLKPENLMLHQGATLLKIGDFNSASQLQAGPQDGVGRVVMLSQRGTPLFVAPEARFGKDWNERVDIWAVGLCAFFMLRRRLPFNMEDPETDLALRSGHLPEIAWDEVSEALRGLVLRCLEVDMRQRPSAMELLGHPVWGTSGRAADLASHADSQCSRSLSRRPRGSRGPKGSRRCRSCTR